MEEQLKTCIMYVDYEGLLVGLSYSQYFDIDNLLVNLLEKAQQRFQVQRAIVLGDWTHHSSRSKLEEQGFLCRSVSATGPEISQMLQATITESLAAGNAAEVYILVSGTSDYNQLLRFLHQANCECLLWTMIMPSPSDQALCSQWELITPPATDETNHWPRQVMLQAIALVADHLQGITENPFMMSNLRDRLAQLHVFNGKADIWLAIASREKILFHQQPGDAFDVSNGYLNRQHPVVQKALFTRERILSTLSSMQAQREWVAFSALEKALRTAKLLTNNQPSRHAWLELLVAEDVLIAGQVPQPDAPFQVTTLRMNQDHPVVAILQHRQSRNLVRLIIVVSDFTSRKGHPWMPIVGLLRILTQVTTRVEARSTVSTAEEQGIIEIGSVPSRQGRSVTTVSLRPDHALVRETLSRRDHLIVLTYSMLTNRKTGASETALIEEFSRVNHMSKDEALFWIRVLISESILYVDQTPLGPGGVAHIIYLDDQHPAVSQVLSSASKRTREVK